MLKGKLVTLRSIEREDLPALATFHNDLEIEILGGGSAPAPQSLAIPGFNMPRESTLPFSTPTTSGCQGN